MAEKKAAAKAASAGGKKFRVTLKRSLIGCSQDQRETVRCIGLRNRQQTVVVADTPAMRGQIMKVQHLVEVSLETK